MFNFIENYRFVVLAGNVFVYGFVAISTKIAKGEESARISPEIL